MKNVFVLCLLLLSTIPIFSQANFKPGYIIMSTGDTLLGEIDYRNWDFNPETISFRQGGSENKYSVTNLSEFSIIDHDLYRRYNVTYHIAATELSDASKNFGNTKETATVFLRYLPASNIGLYELKTKTRVYYFLIDGETITELIYRIKITDGQLLKDDQYKNVLNTYIPESRSIEMGRVLEKIEYVEKDLVRFFTLLNNEAVQKKSNSSKIEWDLSTSISILSFRSDGYFARTVDFKSTAGYKIGGGITLFSQRSLGRFQSRAGLDFSHFKIKGEQPVATGSTQTVRIDGTYFNIEPSVSMGVSLNPLSKIKHILGIRVGYSFVISNELSATQQTQGGSPSKLEIPANSGFMTGSLNYFVRGPWGRLGIEATISSNLLDTPIGKLDGRGLSLVYGYVF